MDELTKKIKGILVTMNSKEVLSEAIHHELQALMDSPDIPVEDKMNYVSGKARQLIATGEDTGLKDSEPRQGSSRAVFFPTQKKLIHLDGHVVETPSVVKIAFPGYLDKHNKSGKLLGEHQNKVESDRSINNEHSIIRQDESTGEWHTNPNGVLPPHFGHHPDHHYLEMGRVKPVSTDHKDESFKEATKTDDHPEGLTHAQFNHAVNEHWSIAHGGEEPQNSKVKHWMSHPLVKNVMHFVGNSDINPGDFHEDNVGIWEHPVTGKKHVVLHDFGYSNQVAHHYMIARMNKENQNNEDY